MKNVLLQAIALGTLLMAASVPSGAAVIYDLSGSGLGGEAAFVYNAPGYVTADSAQIAAALLESCSIEGDGCDFIRILPSGPGDAESHPQIDVTALSGLVSSFYFPYNAFSSSGTYQSVYDFNEATLKVTLVPEPASGVWIGLTAGLMLLAGRKRISSRRAG